MADFETSKRGEDGSDAGSSRRELKIQSLGRKVISQLYMLVRNVKIHAPDNQIFLKPIESFREQVNSVIALDGRFNLQAAGTTIYLNQLPLRVDFTALENVQYLTKEFERKDIGGFTVTRPVTSQEIRDFLMVFAGTLDAPVAEDGVEGHKLSALRMQRFARVKEILDKLEAEPQLDARVDRKKYLMTVYARTVLFMRVYFERLQTDRNVAVPFAKAARLVQDFVDLAHEEKDHFLGMTTMRAESEYLPYHSVNTCLISIVFGGECGLDKRQRHDLGMAALFSQLGMLDVPAGTLMERRSLSPEQRAEIDLFPLRSALRILHARGLDKATMRRIVATYESKVDFAIPRRQENGELALVMPKMGLGLFGKIIAIAETYDALTSKRPFREAYGPEVALALMSGELKYKFDPLLLRIFMRVMAIQPIRIFEPGQGTIRMV